MGSGKSSGYMSVRCYVDEILIPKLPSADKMVATMSIRGTSTTIALEFVRLQPYVSPKIELSDQRLEKVDLRVLPAIFRFQPPADVEVYPGEMVDVYIGAREAAGVAAPRVLRLKSPLVEYAGEEKAPSPPALLVKRP
jgi:HlyD family secretion protein